MRLFYRLAPLLIMLLLWGISASARTSSSPAKKQQGETVLRASQVFDAQRNTVSNIDFYTTNYGIFGNNVQGNTGGGYWPRGSNNQYVFGSGFWFGAVKEVEGQDRKFVELSYTTGGAQSWFVPGRIEDKDAIDSLPSSVKKNRVYVSTDFSKLDGAPLDANDGPAWPMWSTGVDQEAHPNYFGTYVQDVKERNKNLYPEGPFFFSEEDIVSFYKDTDLRYYDGPQQLTPGYPLSLQCEQMICTWGNGEFKDVVLLRYNIINYSPDTLRNCWFAPVMDFDLAISSNLQQGGSNDHCSYFFAEDTLGLAYQWTEDALGEAGKGFGYIGVDLLHTPAVDQEGLIRHDKRFYEESEQIGLQSFRNWSVDEDPQTEEERYKFLSDQSKNGDNGPGDKRMVLSTGPFTMLPGDTAGIVLAMIFAMPSGGGEATGSIDDVQNLVQLDKNVQKFYNQHILTDISERIPPQEPDFVIVPNPMNRSGSLYCTMPSSGRRTIEVIDLMGRTVFHTSALYSAGDQRIPLMTEDIPTGVYYCRITGAGHNATKLISIVR